MMSPKEIRNKMLARIFSEVSFNNEYFEKLGVLGRFDSIQHSNLYVLEDYIKKLTMTQELIEKYKLNGNDLDSEIAFKELKTSVDLVFKPKSFFSFFS